MRTAMCIKLAVFLAAAGFARLCAAETIVDADFSQGDFRKLGWKATGDWDVFTHPAEVPNNPGPAARLPANKAAGALTKTFDEIKNPRKLTLSLDYGWGWGDAAHGGDMAALMLLDAKGAGYVFEVHRFKATWAVQWGLVVDGEPPKDKHWAPEEIDATRRSVREGGGLSHLTITRDVDGTWTIASKDWNQGAGAAVRFNDATTNSFSRLVLLGAPNVDDQLVNHIVLQAPTPAEAAPTVAIPASEFLNSLGVVTTFPDRGQPLEKTIEMVKYAGFRWVRGGIEGLKENGPTTLQTYLDLHEQTGVRFSWGLVSGGTDLEKLLKTARPLAAAGALLAFEGNNEPNNWGVTYQGEPGGGRAPSWRAVAKLQRDLYRAVKDDAVLKDYPVWSISENGGQTDNVGLQFLKIPDGAETLMPAGTQYADYANVHNYIYHPNSPGLQDNKTWNAADPTSGCKVDGLYGNYGRTWAKHFRGYSENELMTLPRVTTETGCTIDGAITEEIQALNLLSLYLDQFKRGWSHTAVYLLRDRSDEAGNQTFGLFKPDYSPRKAAAYLHNLTTILADRGKVAEPGRLKYFIEGQTATIHEMLLQKSDGAFQLVIWGERVQGADEVTLHWDQSYTPAAIYDPTFGTTPLLSPDQPDSLKLTLSDHPLVVEIIPRKQ